MKTHHTRNLSASHKKTSYNISPSPSNGNTHINSLRRDPLDNLQIPDLKFNLNLPNSTKNATSKPFEQPKQQQGNTNVFINNFSVQIRSPITNLRDSFSGSKNPHSARQPEKKQPIPASKGDRVIEDPTPVKVSYTGRSSTTKSSYPITDFTGPKSSRESTGYNASPYTLAKSKPNPVLGSRPSDSNIYSSRISQFEVGRVGMRPAEVGHSDFLTKLKKNTPSNEPRMLPPSPRINTPSGDAATRPPSHIKNKRSLDVASLYTSEKKSIFPESYGKNTGTTNSSTNETETHSRHKSTDMDNGHHTPSYSKNVNLKPSTPVKNTFTTPPVKIDNYLNTYKHKRVPSFDVGSKNDNLFQKNQGPDLDRIRKSTDNVVDFKSEYLSNPSPSTLSYPTSADLVRRNPLRFAIRTRAGANSTGARKTNQDSYIVHSSFGRNPNRYLFGICDGHGSNGHHVSGFVKENLPMYLLADPFMETRPEVTFTNAFELCHQKLLLCDFDSKFSGTTSVSLLITGNRIISANAGDSRAVMATYNKGWDFVSLTNDHKPNLLAEAQRILMAGGRIEAFKDGEGNYVGPSRVWLANQDIPGLAMSRSIGDLVASSVGVTCRPEIKEFQITTEDKFIIVASDGIWEFLESMEVVKLIAPFYERNDLDGACDFLLNTAVKRWQQEEENVIDDITFVLVFL